MGESHGAQRENSVAAAFAEADAFPVPTLDSNSRKGQSRKPLISDKIVINMQELKYVR